MLQGLVRRCTHPILYQKIPRWKTKNQKEILYLFSSRWFSVVQVLHHFNIFACCYLLHITCNLGIQSIISCFLKLTSQQRLNHLLQICKSTKPCHCTSKSPLKAIRGTQRKSRFRAFVTSTRQPTFKCRTHARTRSVVWIYLRKSYAHLKFAF